MRQRWLAALVVFVVGLGLASPGYAMAKIGYMNVGRAFENYQKTKDQEATLEALSKKKADERVGQVEMIRDMRSELELLSPDARRGKEQEIENGLLALKEFDNQSRQDLREQHDTMVREILEEINAAVIDYAKKEEFAFIFNERVLLFGEEANDITDPVLQILNEGYKNDK
ncbi:MAG: OmpH family outer membrane protein [Candidatus Omnitrophica bacterium]|nr:OmpH family outer membrane protein [Candidatus Omnitrophota bacterium]